MGRPRRLLRSRHIVALVIGLATPPVIALIWAGYLLLEQNRQLEEGRRKERLQHASHAVVADLERALLAAERTLAAGQEWWPEGAVAVTFRGNRATVTPAGRVAFLPVPDTLPAADASVLQRGRALEYRGNVSAATSVYRQAAESGNVRERVAALLPLGRLLAKHGRSDDALGVFARLLEAPLVEIDGTPSRLAARYWRCVVLENTSRRSELREEAARFITELQVLAPYLAGAAYKDFATVARRWSGHSLDQAAVRRAEALEAMWDRWQSPGRRNTSGREAMSIDGTDLVVLWQVSSRDAGVVRALVATPDFVTREWLKRAQAVAHAHDARIDGAPTTGGTDPSGREGRPATVGAAGITSMTIRSELLPWSMTISDTGGETSLSLSRRRDVVLASLAVLTALMVGAGYAIIRSFEREIAVARLQSDFVSAVSHEFRTPLTALKHFVEILRERPALDAADRRECYDAQGRAVDRLSRLVESLLDFGRLEGGTQRYRFVPQDCTTLARTVVDEFNHHAQHAGYRAELQPHVSATVNVDAEAFSRALWNLLENAMKYSPGHKTILVGIHATDGEARIAVRDRGLGVPAHEATVIFQRFRRGADARVRGIPGTGIGLAMVHDIMQAHGGRVDVATGAGEGSTFTLVVPLAS